MMNEYQHERSELARLGLIIGPSTLEDPIARRCLAQSMQKKIEENRVSYLMEHGAEEVKKKFPRCWAECWPGL